MWLLWGVGNAFRDSDANAGDGSRCRALNAGCDNIGVPSHRIVALSSLAD